MESCGSSFLGSNNKKILRQINPLLSCLSKHPPNSAAGQLCTYTCFVLGPDLLSAGREGPEWAESANVKLLRRGSPEVWARSSRSLRGAQMFALPVRLNNDVD
jgi:hypothetical protein